ncbi:MAG TPA: hypothetical protein VJX67_23140 [Blastocatellia bacterium]|nr:hypothetical protein [Blastocatellia bacterium]
MTQEESRGREREADDARGTGRKADDGRWSRLAERQAWKQDKNDGAGEHFDGHIRIFDPTVESPVHPIRRLRSRHVWVNSNGGAIAE